jgi:LAO/AO transport system kinase
MEIADIFVINKADLAGADRLESELRAMLSLGSETREKEPPIVRTVATQGTGIEELAALLTTAPLAVERPADYWEWRLIEMVRERLMDTVVEKALPAERLSEAAQKIVTRRLNPFSFADELTRDLLSDSLLSRPKAD